MFSNIGDYVTSEEMELEGIDLSFGKGRFITIKRAGGANKAYQVYVLEEYNKLKDETPTDDEAKQVLFTAFAKHIALSWRGWKGEGGKDIPFTEANMVALFKASEEIYQRSMTEAENKDNFRAEEIAESGNE